MTNFFSLRKSIDLVELVRAMIFFSISLRSAGKINAKNPSICSRRPALYHPHGGINYSFTAIIILM